LGNSLRWFFIDSKSLTNSEWFFGFALLIVLATFFLIAKKTSFRDLERLSQSKQALPVPLIAVDVSGCVKKPGTISVAQGATVRYVLRKARVEPLADLSNIDLDRPLDASCSLYIPALEKILVDVQGCVEERGTIELPAGSRICDLKKHLKLSNRADLTFFRRRKILKNNEIVRIPPKNNDFDASDSGIGR